MYVPEPVPRPVFDPESEAEPVPKHESKAEPVTSCICVCTDSLSILSKN